MKVLICGDRKWGQTKDELFLMFGVIYDLKEQYGDELIIISGGACAKGADYQAMKVSLAFHINFEEYKAAWGCLDNQCLTVTSGVVKHRDVHGRAAGIIRNQKMLDQNPDQVIAFHNNLIASRGTKDMVKRAHQAGVKVTIYRLKDHGGGPEVEAMTPEDYKDLIDA